MKALRGERGAGLVELLVAIALSVVLFGVVLTVLDVYMRQSNAATQRNDAQDKARLGIDRIVRQMRNIASPITTPRELERATKYDIVFQTVGTPTGANASGVERVRYCIPQDSTAGDPTKEVLYSQTQTWNTATPAADPWTSDPTVTIPCPDPTFTADPGKIVAPSVVNRYQQTDHPAFTFNNSPVAPSDLSQISTVQIDLLSNPTPTVTKAVELQSAAYLRNQAHAPVADFTWTATGNGVVVLDGGTSYSPDGDVLSYSWACTAPVSCPASAALAATSDGLVTWQPGAGNYWVRLTVTDPNGLTTSKSYQVTVT